MLPPQGSYKCRDVVFLELYWWKSSKLSLCLMGLFHISRLLHDSQSGLAHMCRLRKDLVLHLVEKDWNTLQLKHFKVNHTHKYILILFTLDVYNLQYKFLAILKTGKQVKSLFSQNISLTLIYENKLVSWIHITRQRGYNYRNCKVLWNCYSFQLFKQRLLERFSFEPTCPDIKGCIKENMQQVQNNIIFISQRSVYIKFC